MLKARSALVLSWTMLLRRRAKLLRAQTPALVAPQTCIPNLLLASGTAIYLRVSVLPQMCSQVILTSYNGQSFLPWTVSESAIMELIGCKGDTISPVRLQRRASGRLQGICCEPAAAEEYSSHSSFPPTLSDHLGGVYRPALGRTSER